MKTKSISLLSGIFAISASLVIAQSQFSGIYSGKVSGGPKFKLALTKGGRALGLDQQAKGLGDALDPAKSTINSKGRLKGATPNGAVIDATVSGSKISGTVKDGKNTLRITGERIYN